MRPYEAAWDRLAVETERPYCAPGWLLSWWAHARPSDAEMRVVVALANGELLGVAPMFVRYDRLRVACYSFMSGGIASRVEPLARAGSERDVARAITHSLAIARPAVGLIRFEALPSDSLWPELLADLWPGGRGAWLRREQVTPAPAVTIGEGEFDTWMKSKSSNFRQQMRRSRRKLEAAGAVFRTADLESLDRDLESFVRLHRARWAGRGGSSALLPGVDDMLEAAGRSLCASGRFRLESIDIDGRTISSQLFMIAGKEMSYWLGGFDDDWAAQRPTIVALVAAIEEAHGLGYRRFDLGPGAMDYKYRMSDGEDQLEWTTLVPRGRRYPFVRARLLPRDLRGVIAARLSKKRKRLLLRLLRPFSST